MFLSNLALFRLVFCFPLVESGFSELHLNAARLNHATPGEAKRYPKCP